MTSLFNAVTATPPNGVQCEFVFSSDNEHQLTVICEGYDTIRQKVDAAIKALNIDPSVVQEIRTVYLMDWIQAHGVSFKPKECIGVLTFQQYKFLTVLTDYLNNHSEQENEKEVIETSTPYPKFGSDVEEIVCLCKQLDVQYKINFQDGDLTTVSILSAGYKIFCFKDYSLEKVMRNAITALKGMQQGLAKAIV